MSLSTKPYKGTRDFFPAEKRVRDYIFQKMRETCELFAFESYDGPLLEEVELYRAKSGEELVGEQMYDFLDRGKRHVAIRPEMTPTVARMVAARHREEAKPIRWFSIPNLYRYERPQKGRLREHWQFNCDIFGAPEGFGEVEIVALLITLLQKLGANEKQFNVLYNDRQVIDTVFETIFGLDQEKQLALYKIVDKAKKLPADKLSTMIEELGVDKKIQESIAKYLQVKTIPQLLSFLGEHQDRAQRLLDFTEQMKLLEMDQYLVYDPTIVRGLDYYTGLVFECFDRHPDNPRAICGGGAYADLMKIFNQPPLPAVGFGLGDVTLTHFLTTHQLLPDLSKPHFDVYLIFLDEQLLSFSQKVAKTLRSLGHSVCLHPKAIALKKSFDLANKKGSRFLGILGTEEQQNQTIQLKNLSNKKQESLSLSDLQSIKDLLHE